MLSECADLKKTMSDMMDIMDEMKNMIGGKQVQSSVAQEAAPAAKESQAIPNAA
jgi:hypothetical protein